MGQVYRARDTKLDRDVAIKVLPGTFAQDADRLARFTREAKTLASLNHPNIAQIFGIEESQGFSALVMELVEGEDLSALIRTHFELRSSNVEVLEWALPIAKQVADALEAAHEQGIIHRDLKPANIKVRADGTVKVLDFGLAKALDTNSSGATAGGAANSPTLTNRATQIGMILGTAAYMAPEQARGKAVDRRADVWAFGVVLYEMLTGRRAFEGEEVSDVLAAVLRQEIDFAALPAQTPPSVRRMLRRCLEKDPRKRLSAIGDARLDLDDLETAPAGPPSAVTQPARPSLLSRLWPAVAGVLLTAAVAVVLWPKATTSPAGSLARLSLLPPPGSELYPDSTGVIVSPDGTMVAFVIGSVTQSATQLWVRSLDSMVARRLDDADGAILPFWSPDSRRIGFFNHSKLKTIAVSGGRAETLCDSPDGRGAAWSPSNVIVFAKDASGPLYRVSASGGTAEPITELDTAKKESGHRFPAFLPDGEHFLYAVLPGKRGKFEIYAGSTADKSRTYVGSLESAPVFATSAGSELSGSGWLLYSRQGVLAAQGFDPRTFKLAGDPVPLEDEPTSILDPAISYTAGRAVSISRTGSLAYYSSPSLNTTAAWYDTNGVLTGKLDVPPGHYETISIAPDGSHAVFVRSTSSSESALWLVDLARGGAVPLSTGPGRNDTPVWSPDGKRVIFAADRDGRQQIYVKTIDEARPEQLLFQSDTPFKGPTAWSPDGQWIAITQLDPETAQNVWRLPAAGGELAPFVRGRGRDNGGPVSPDGHWMAYASDETGRFEVYVESFPEPGRRVKVSQQGGAYAWWTRDGRQLLFTGAEQHTLWRVDVETGATFHAGVPKQIGAFPSNILWMDAMPDRQRFLAVAPERTGVGSMTLVQNWMAAMSSPAPAARR